MKLNKIHKAAIIHAAAFSAYGALVDAERRDAVAWYCDGDEDERRAVADTSHARTEAAYAPQFAVLDRIMDSARSVLGPDSETQERRRRHVIRDLVASPRLRLLAELYYSRHVDHLVGGTDDREGRGVRVGSFGYDWRTAPGVWLRLI